MVWAHVFLLLPLFSLSVAIFLAIFNHALHREYKNSSAYSICECKVHWKLMRVSVSMCISSLIQFIKIPSNFRLNRLRLKWTKIPISLHQIEVPNSTEAPNSCSVFTTFSMIKQVKTRMEWTQILWKVSIEIVIKHSHYAYTTAFLRRFYA